MSRLSDKCTRCSDLEWMYQKAEELQKLEAMTSNDYVKIEAGNLKEICISMINRSENEDCKCGVQLMLGFPV